MIRPTTIIRETIEDAQKFLSGKNRNLHIRDSRHICEVYVRKALHMINGELIDTFDIGSILIDSKWRSKGIGLAVIAELHQIHDRQATYIENLLNGRLYIRLKSLGWENVRTKRPLSLGENDLIWEKPVDCIPEISPSVFKYTEGNKKLT